MAKLLIDNNYTTLGAAALAAGYANYTANDPSRSITERPGFRNAVRELIPQNEVDDLYNKIRTRLNKIITSEKSYNSDAIKASDLVLRATGGLAPERHEVVALTPLDRKERYDDVLRLVRAEQATTTPKVERSPDEAE